MVHLSIQSQGRVHTSTRPQRVPFSKRKVTEWKVFIIRLRRTLAFCRKKYDSQMMETQGFFIYKDPVNKRVLLGRELLLNSRKTYFFLSEVFHDT